MKVRILLLGQNIGRLVIMVNTFALQAKNVGSSPMMSTKRFCCLMAKIFDCLSKDEGSIPFRTAIMPL